MKNLFLTLAIFIFFSINLIGQKEATPFNIGEKIVLKSEILNQEREIFIALPYNYNDAEENYSVHYILDGNITFPSYSSIVNLKYFNKTIPGAIVVGITQIDRKNELNPKTNGADFLDFITKELIPYIDNNYRTDENRLLMGYSMAGNFAMYTFLNDKESFNMFLSGAPYRLDLYTDEDVNSLLNHVNTKKSIYTSMGSHDQPNQLEFFRIFCESFDTGGENLVDFKYEIIDKRDHKNTFLLNWQDGLDYIYRDWNKKE